jgi:hypothetical protein
MVLRSTPKIIGHVVVVALPALPALPELRNTAPVNENDGLFLPSVCHQHRLQLNNQPVENHTSSCK